MTKGKKMHIDKYKTEDGYCDESGCHYANAEEFLQTNFLGFCGCGDPDENLKYIRDGLAHIDAERTEPFKDWYEKWTAEGLKIFGNENSRQFFFYWADSEELTEHGGSVSSGGWLSAKGKQLLDDLNELISNTQS